MSTASLDLSILDALEAFGSTKVGQPLLLDLERIHEDPNQPRKAFDGLLELAQSIAEVGVKVPITVLPHPVMDGHYLIKFGARRRRAALSAGLTQIPAWLEQVPSDFEQVIENLQRSDLTAMELAVFMAEKIGAGMKHGEIARKLGVSRSAVTKHLSLVNAPAEIEAVYRTGRNTSPETLFELRALYIRYPEQTAAWLAQDVEISRRSVEALKTSLNTAHEGALVAAAKPGRTARVADPAEIKRPVMAVKVADRFGIVVLTRRAIEEDHILVKWDDTAEVSAIPCADIRLLRLDDARRYEPINRGLTD